MWKFVFVPALTLLGAVAAAQGAPATSLSAAYQQLARPTLTRSTEVNSVKLTVGGMEFYLDRGAIAVAETGPGGAGTAVFQGAGRVRVNAVDLTEAGQIQRFLGRNAVTGDFTAAIFRFSDGAAFLQQLGPAQPWRSQVPGAARKLLEERDQDLERIGATVFIRQFDAGSAVPRRPFLRVAIEGTDGEWLQADNDPRLSLPARVSRYVESPETGAVVREILTAYRPTPELAPMSVPRLDNYTVSTRINGNGEADVSARFDLTALAPGETGALLSLAGAWHVESAAAADGATLEYVQAPAVADWLYVGFPQPLAADQSITVILRYSAKHALAAAGIEPDWASVAGWYPTAWRDDNLTPSAANFRLHFEYPAKFTLLASGAVHGKSVAGDVATSDWTSVGPAPAAGFVLGQDDLSQVRLQLADGHGLDVTLSVPRRDQPRALAALAGSHTEDFFNFMASEFGPYRGTSVSIALTGAATDQALPQLITYDPRLFLGDEPVLSQFNPALAAAGQWWGAGATPAAPADEWLVAGLREISALLFQQSRFGADAARDTVNTWRQYLLSRGRFDAQAPAYAGPITLGSERLSSATVAGDVLVAARGGYVLYSLRQLMLDPRAPDPDAAFQAMMRELTLAAAQGPLTTAAFERIAARHMPPSLDLDHDHSLQWFFKPLLEGAAVPTLSFTASIQPAVNGVAQVHLSVENPDDWRGLLPVYLFKDEKTWVRGLLPVTSAHATLTVPVPFTPAYVEANHFLDLLLNVRQ